MSLPADHRWFPILTAVIFLVVRVLKSDTPLPTVPPRWRAPLAVGLGLLGAVVEKVATGASWSNALADGIVASLSAIASHELIVESARNGRDLGTPKDRVPPPG